MPRNLRTIAVVIAALVLAVATYVAYERHAKRTHVVSMLGDATARLRTTLQAQAVDNTAGNTEANATAVEAYAATLRSMDTSSFSPLAAAADDYLVTVREIMRRAADIQRVRARLAISFDALATHIRTDRGAAAWTQQAVRLKQDVDKDLRDYRIAAESFATLIDTLSASQAKIAPFVDAAALVEPPLIGTARSRTLDAYTAAEQNVRQVSDLGAYRRRR